MQYTSGDGYVAEYNWAQAPYFSSENEFRLNDDVRKTQDIQINHIKGSKDVLKVSSYVYFRARTFDRIVNRLSGFGEDQDTTALDEYNRSNPDAQITSITLHTNGMVACKLAPHCVSDTHVGDSNVKAMVEDTLGERVHDNLDKVSNFILRVPEKDRFLILADLDAGIFTQLTSPRYGDNSYRSHSGSYAMGELGKRAVWGI